MKFIFLFLFSLFSTIGLTKVRHYDLVDKIMMSSVILEATCVKIKTTSSLIFGEEQKEVQFGQIKVLKGRFSKSKISFGPSIIKKQIQIGCKGGMRIQFKFVENERVLLFLYENGNLRWKEPEIKIDKIIEIVSEDNLEIRKQLILTYYAVNSPNLKEWIENYVLKNWSMMDISQMKHIVLNCAENRSRGLQHRYQAYQCLEDFYDEDLECLLLRHLENGDRIEKIVSMKILAKHKCQEAIFPIQKLLFSLIEDKFVRKVAGDVIGDF